MISSAGLSARGSGGGRQSGKRTIVSHNPNERIAKLLRRFLKKARLFKALTEATL